MGCFMGGHQRSSARNASYPNGGDPPDNRRACICVVFYFSWQHITKGQRMVSNYFTLCVEFYDQQRTCNLGRKIDYCGAKLHTGCNLSLVACHSSDPSRWK